MPRRPKWMRRRDKSQHGQSALKPSSGLLGKQEMTVERSIGKVDDSVVTKDLWNEAYTDLRQSENVLVNRCEKILLSESLDEQGANPKAEQLSRVVEAKLAQMERDKWVVNHAGKSIEVRNQIERLVKFVGKVKESLSVVANIDPIHLGVPVAAMCLLTSVSSPSWIYCLCRS